MITNEQFDRWKDFSMRMARTCFRHRRRPSTAEIVENVAFVFSCIDADDLLSFVDWDHSEPYPKGSRGYRKTYRCPCWHCHGQRKPDCPYECEDGSIYDYASAGYLCDRMSVWGEHFNPYYWSASDAESERRDEQFCGPVRCCVRAGMDLAISPSMGVMGFTAGDLRRMYPEGVPDWVTGGKEHRWTTQNFDGVVPGVGLIPGKSELNGTFAEMPDSAGVWL